MIYRSHIFYFFLLLSTLSFNQNCTNSIRGVAFDAKSGEAIEFGHIHISETKSVGVSNEQGEFLLTDVCAGKVTVCFHHINYKEGCKTFNLHNDTTLTFEMQRIIQDIDEVDIEIVLHEKSDPHLKVETKKMIQNIGKPIGSSIEQITGVTSLNTGNGVSKPVIHGMHSNRVVIMNDNVRLEGQQWGGDHAPEIDPFVIEEIEVIKGASSVLYGSDAIAGVVLLKPSILPDTIGVSGKFQNSIFSNGRGVASSMTVQGKMNRGFPISYEIQGSGQKSGNLKTPNYYLDNTGIEGYNFSTRVGSSGLFYDVEMYYRQFNSKLGIFSGAHIGNLTDLENAIAGYQDLSSTRFSYQLSTPFQKIFHETMGVKTNWYLSRNGEIEANFSRQKNHRREFDAHGSTYEGIAELDLTIYTDVAEVKWKHSPVNNWSSVVGVSGTRQTNLYKGRYFIPNFLSYAGGLFTYQRYKKNTWSYELGFRYDSKTMDTYRRNDAGDLLSESHVFHNFSWNGLVEKSLNENNKLVLNGGFAWRPPSIAELYADGVHHGAASYEVGDLELKEEQVWNISSTYHHQKKFFDLELNAFLNYFPSFLYLRPRENPILTIRGAFPAFDYIQTEASIKGVDVFLKYQSDNGFYASNKSALLWAIDESNGNYLVGIPANMFTSAIGYQRENSQKWYAEVESHYVMKQSRIDLNFEIADSPDAYHLIHLNFGLTGSFLAKETSITLGVENLFNTKYRDYLNRLRYFSDDVGTNINLNTIIKF